MKKPRRTRNRKPARTTWDPLAFWYDGWVGPDGSHFHQKVAVPAVMDLLQLQPHERVLDLGAGQGVLCPHVVKAESTYTGIDLSPRLIKMAQKHHRQLGRFLVGDATRLQATGKVDPGAFDAVVFLLSLQDMDPLDEAIQGASWALGEAGRLVVLLTHPCFRIPRQSGWGWDPGRKLQYRRIDRYLTALEVPLKAHPGKERGVSRSFHRPLHDYVTALANSGFLIDSLRELPTYKEVRNTARAKAINRANAEIPLFLALRAKKAKSA